MTGSEASATVIVLIDEQPLFMEGLAASLAAIPHVRVITVARWDDLDQVADVEGDVIVCDPVANGEFRIGNLDTARRFWPRARHVVLTNHTGRQAVVAALARGAHSIIFKYEPSATIRTAIELVCRGGIAFSLPAAITAMTESIPVIEVPSAGVPLPPAGVRGLTPREIQAIQLVARGHTDAEIGSLLNISPRTVERHITNILNKLGCRNRSHAVALVVGAAPPLVRKHY